MLTSIASRTSAGYRGTSTAAAGMPIITKSRRKFSGTSSNWIVIWLTALVTCSLSGSVAGRCTSDSLVLYRAELTTKWSRDAFPKHYPEWRPPAQWTKFIGRSHDDTFSLFRIGETASEGMQSFAESGRSELLDEHAQGKDGILDSFAGPAISQGAGKSNAEFFADANHTLVSFASRIVPSPDWIIGMDSLNLCADGRWADVMSVESILQGKSELSGFSQSLIMVSWDSAGP
ncbi:unnamed protein product [Notodromas monacha]|uniref:Spondin domain-containing protein n=1 Tax=Notodromas monacha TaxID=399045 RepID=A0A7R9BNE1_9CRUS|nr:unnamed protein product [Notodromas monacha]CAG0917874.1 unnamed protein product [Notodromas monacha]